MGRLLDEVDGCALVGMVHLGPLPGSPGWRGDLGAVLDAAERDADALLEGGADALLVENMGDLPYLRGGVPPWTVAAMALATERVVRRGVPVGVQVLAAANREALGVALAAGARFLRVEAFAYAHVADEGWLDACAGPLLRDRAALGADVRVWADIRKKHAAHAVTADLDLGAIAKGTAFCGADALIVTGESTGAPTSRADVVAARAAGLPVVVGSGVDERDAGVLGEVADALIVGTSLKVGGDWRAPVDPARVRTLKAAISAGRG
ncbi:MAG: BtpA/SgcQ family protein [Alphaproteobacteria bacterium]|nr:BtpA/SgcQ family protein [Alphaproteobacteria bacterium]MCB9695721.1 BtpA/SgcQ family protein [Alphaproteobacteria bacterium]